MPRELLLLRLLASAQPINTWHVASFMEVSRQVACRSVRKLRDLGLIRVFVPAHAGPNYLVLAPKGASLLAEKFGLDESSLRTPRGIGAVQLAHHNQVVEMHVALVLACTRSKSFKLKTFVHEAQLRGELGVRAGDRVPDGVAVLEHDTGCMALALESDTGSDNPSRVAAQKGWGYSELASTGATVYGCSRWAVAFICSSVRRRNRLAQAFYQHDLPEGLFLYVAASDVDSRTVLGRSWLTQRSQDGVAELQFVEPSEVVSPGRNSGWYGQQPQQSRDSE